MGKKLSEIYEQSELYQRELNKVTEVKLNEKGIPEYCYGIAGNGKRSLFVGWKPLKKDEFATTDGKVLVVKFDKFLNEPNFAVYNNFTIRKSSYEKQIELIAKYMNFYTTFYDVDREFIVSYQKVKFELDNRKRFTEENSNAFIDFMYEVIVTPTFAGRIARMINDVYIDDIEGSIDGKARYVKSETKHLESLEFTNQHVKILLKISTVMKLLAPLIFQYVHLNVIKLDKDSDLIYRCYERLFQIFSENVDIYNKLVVYTRAKVLESKAHNPAMYEQRDIFGNDEAILINRLVKKVLISDNIFKFKFPEKWDKKNTKFSENIVGFLKTILKFQLNYFIKQQFETNLTEMTNSNTADGVSDMDKMRCIMNKIDEGDVVASLVNCKKTIEFIKKNVDIEVTDDELQYYRIHHKPSEFQVRLVSAYWCKYFGSYRDTYNLVRKEYLYLMLVLKKKLLIASGFSPSSIYDGRCVLPFLISGNVSDKVNMRLIRNTKFISKIDENSTYKSIMSDKYSLLEEIQPNAITMVLSQIINTEFTFVVYEDPAVLGNPIVYNEDIISDEILNFINMI